MKQKMKLNITFSKKESELLAMVAKKYDFMNYINTEKLANKYHEGNEAGRFTDYGMKSEGTTINFETHEKLMVAACNVYLKYADTVNGILCGIKSVVMSCKSLFHNFESDYKAELNKAFEEIRVESDIKKEAKKAEEEIKRKFDRIKQVEKETEDDDELY